MIEKVFGVESAVAHKLVQRAVHLVRSRHAHNADLPSGAFAVFRSVGIGHHVEFAHRVNAQQFAADSARNRMALAGPHVLNSVEQKQVFAETPARNTE